MKYLSLLIISFFLVNLSFAEDNNISKKLSVPSYTQESKLLNTKGSLEKTRDMNKDGEVDLWQFSLKKGSIIKVVRDLNFDGNIDTVHLAYLRDGIDGQWEKMIYDNNNDKIIDSICYFDTSNNWIKREIDSDFDGNLDTIFYSNGKILKKVEADFNNDGLIDMIKKFANGKLISCKVDINYDGNVDKNFSSLSEIKAWLKKNRTTNTEYLRNLAIYFN